ncbi:hypothetical protein CBR_g31080 [Chara braunii]|uniref:Uncharacterized protein n=1 Tax=Chara braunii TaxID=69332 RepID=A0A388LE87_CHABU|nr:hypothetical protein CBR_g31080 [Chara braunii]|eukprot:GBG80620.1 hypothetical protein CBR_g31080 [Chara braunii]
MWIERIWNHIRGEDGWEDIAEGKVESVGTVVLSEQGWHLICTTLAARQNPMWLLEGAEARTRKAGERFANKGWDEVHSKVVMGGWKEFRPPCLRKRIWVPQFVVDWFGGFDHVAEVASTMERVHIDYTWLSEEFYKTSLKYGPFHSDRAWEVLIILNMDRYDQLEVAPEIREAIIRREVAATPCYVDDVFKLFEGTANQQMAMTRAWISQRPTHPRPPTESGGGWEVSLPASYMVRGIDTEWRAVTLGRDQTFMMVECLWSGMRFDRGPGDDLYTDLKAEEKQRDNKEGERTSTVGEAGSFEGGLKRIVATLTPALNKNQGYLADAKKKLTFDGANITEFLIDYENLAALLKWTEEEKMDHLGQHVSLSLGRDIMAIVASSGSWKETRNEMMRKYLNAEKMATEAELAAVQRKNYATYNDFLRAFTLVALRIPGVTDRIMSKDFLRQFSEFDKDKILHYLFGRRFILRFDPTNVIGALRNYKPIDPTVGRWIGFIWQFDYKVERIAGLRNRADGLRRVCITPEGVQDAEPIDGFLEYEGGTLVIDNEMAGVAPTMDQLLIQTLEKGAPAIVAELWEGPVTTIIRKDEKDSWGATIGPKEELMAMVVEGGRDAVMSPVETWTQRERQYLVNQAQEEQDTDQNGR